MKKLRTELDFSKDVERLRKPAILESSETGNLLDDLVHQAAEDLKHKIAAGAATPKDIGVLLKLIESYSKLETLKLRKEEANSGDNTVDEALRLIKVIQENQLLEIQE